LTGWLRSAATVEFPVVYFVDPRFADDPDNKGQMRPDYDSGDHLHPSSKGAKAIADTIPLNWFQ